jgi:hypothetical protein
MDDDPGLPLGADQRARGPHRVGVDVDQVHLGEVTGERLEIDVAGVPRPEQTEPAAAAGGRPGPDLGGEPGPVPGEVRLVPDGAPVRFDLIGNGLPERAELRHWCRFYGTFMDISCAA